MALSYWLSACGLGLSIVMIAAIVVASRKPAGKPPYLALVFLEAAAFFLATIAGDSRGGIVAAALSYCVSLIGLPSLYLYERSAVGEHNRGAWRHYLPAFVNLPIGLSLSLLGPHWRLGLPMAAYYAALTMAQTAQLILYGRAALRIARGYGGKPNWLLRVSWAVIAAYGVIIALSWAVLGVLAAEELFGCDIDASPWMDPVSILAVVFLAWTLGLCLVWGGERASGESTEARKYGGRPLPRTEAVEIVKRTRALLAESEDLAEEAVEPRSLARRLGVPYYALSRAVNELEGMSLLELANEYRVERAKEILRSRPEASILDACYEAGFQAKSTFNDVFRRRVGMSPRDYRRARTAD